MKLNDRQSNLIKVTPKSLIERSSGSLVKRGLADIVALEIAAGKIKDSEHYENLIKDSISKGQPSVESLISVGFDKGQASIMSEKSNNNSLNSTVGFIDTLIALGIDKEEATFVVCAFIMVGKDGVIEIERGIHGNAYSIEQKDYSHVRNSYTFDTAMKEIKRFEQLIKNTSDNIDKQKFARCIAEIVDAVVVIKVNYYTEDEFIIKQNYLIKAIGLAKEILHGPKSVQIPEDEISQRVQ